MQKVLSFVIRCLVVISMVTGSFAAGRDERNKASSPKLPPQPVEQNLKVQRGEKLTISLKIYGSQREVLRFLIRKDPAAGKLSKVRPVDRESASVIYEPPKDLNVVADRFSYAVQNSAGVSASVEVNIAIVDEPPMLGIPDSLDFQPILAGKVAVQEIEVINRGGGMAAGDVEVEDPWRLDGKSAYRLGAGESAKFKVVYAPKSGGVNRGEVKFTSDRTRVIALKGEAMAPIAAVPATLELVSQPGSARRLGAFELVNSTGEAVKVSISPSSNLLLPASIEVPANGRATVTVETKPEAVAGIAEDLSLDGSGVAVRIPVRAKPIGPVLQRVSPDLEFGASADARMVEVQNIGGAEGYWRWEQLAPFVFAEEGFRLAPGAKKQLAVSIDPNAKGEFDAVLRLVGEQQFVEVPAKAHRVDASVGPRSATPLAGKKDREIPRGLSVPATLVSARKGTLAIAEAPERQATAEPLSLARLQVEVIKIEPTRATVAWPVSGSGTFRLEERDISKPKEGGLKIEWHDVKAVEFRKEGKQVIAVLDHLVPSRAYMFRVFDAAQPAGGFALTHFQVATPQVKPMVIFTPIRGLFLLLALLVGAIFWQRRKVS